MIEKFTNWYQRNDEAITWFIIGLLTFDALSNLAHGNYVNAIIPAILAYGNYYFNRKC